MSIDPAVALLPQKHARFQPEVRDVPGLKRAYPPPMTIATITEVPALRPCDTQRPKSSLQWLDHLSNVGSIQGLP